MVRTNSVAPTEANIPEVVEPSDPATARRTRQWQVVVGYRILARFGLDEGIAGHITARDPDMPETFWTAPFGRYFGRVRPSDLIRVNSHGDVVEGDGLLNRAALAIHSEVHAARPDVIGAVHAHGMYGKAFSSLGRPLLPLTQDACAFFDDHGIHAEYGGVVLDATEGRLIARALGNSKAVILANHGHLTVGTSVASAVWWFVTMERSFQAQLLAEAADGEPHPLDEAVARATWRSVGTEDVGAFAFSVLAERMVAEQPDLAEFS